MQGQLPRQVDGSRGPALSPSSVSDDNATRHSHDRQEHNIDEDKQLFSIRTTEIHPAMRNDQPLSPQSWTAGDDDDDAGPHGAGANSDANNTIEYSSSSAIFHHQYDWLSHRENAQQSRLGERQTPPQHARDVDVPFSETYTGYATADDPRGRLTPSAQVPYRNSRVIDPRGISTEYQLADLGPPPEIQGPFHPRRNSSPWQKLRGGPNEAPDLAANNSRQDDDDDSVTDAKPAARSPWKRLRGRSRGSSVEFADAHGPAFNSAQRPVHDRGVGSFEHQNEPSAEKPGQKLTSRSREPSLDRGQRPPQPVAEPTLSGLRNETRRDSIQSQPKTNVKAGPSAWKRFTRQTRSRSRSQSTDDDRAKPFPAYSPPAVEKDRAHENKPTPPKTSMWTKLKARSRGGSIDRSEAAEPSVHPPRASLASSKRDSRNLEDDSFVPNVEGITPRFQPRTSSLGLPQHDDQGPRHPTTRRRSSLDLLRAKFRRTGSAQMRDEESALQHGKSVTAARGREVLEYENAVTPPSEATGFHGTYSQYDEMQNVPGSTSQSRSHEPFFHGQNENGQRIEPHFDPTHRRTDYPRMRGFNGTGVTPQQEVGFHEEAPRTGTSGTEPSLSLYSSYSPNLSREGEQPRSTKRLVKTQQRKDRETASASDPGHAVSERSSSRLEEAAYAQTRAPPADTSAYQSARHGPSHYSTGLPRTNDYAPAAQYPDSRQADYRAYSYETDPGITQATPRAIHSNETGGASNLNRPHEPSTMSLADASNADQSPQAATNLKEPTADKRGNSWFGNFLSSNDERPPPKRLTKADRRRSTGRRSQVPANSKSDDGDDWAAQLQASILSVGDSRVRTLDGREAPIQNVPPVPNLTDRDRHVEYLQQQEIFTSRPRSVGPKEPKAYPTDSWDAGRKDPVPEESQRDSTTPPPPVPPVPQVFQNFHQYSPAQSTNPSFYNLPERLAKFEAGRPRGSLPPFAPKDTILLVDPPQPDADVNPDLSDADSNRGSSTSTRNGLLSANTLSAGDRPFSSQFPNAQSIPRLVSPEPPRERPSSHIGAQSQNEARQEEHFPATRKAITRKPTPSQIQLATLQSDQQQQSRSGPALQAQTPFQTRAHTPLGLSANPSKSNTPTVTQSRTETPQPTPNVATDSTTSSAPVADVQDDDRPPARYVPYLSHLSTSTASTVSPRTSRGGETFVYIPRDVTTPILPGAWNPREGLPNTPTSAMTSWAMRQLDFGAEGPWRGSGSNASRQSGDSGSKSSAPPSPGGSFGNGPGTRSSPRSSAIGRKGYRRNSRSGMPSSYRPVASSTNSTNSASSTR